MSQYLEALRQAMVIYPMIVVLFTVPYIAWSYHKYGSVLSLRVLIVYSFLLYLLCVYCLVILPLPTPEKAATLHGHKAQLIPFSFSCRYSQASRNPTWTACQLASHFHRQRLLDNHFQSIYDDAVWRLSEILLLLSLA